MANQDTNSIFVPIADGISAGDEPVRFGPRAMGAYEWEPEIRDPGSQLITPCRLNLKQGCYQIGLENSGDSFLFQPRFRGVMRVENGDDHTTISGDFYKLSRPYWNIWTERPELIIEGAEYDGRSVIPVYRRRRYYSYLRVVNIWRSPVSYINHPCTITLTVEEYRYTHPEAGEARGSFPVRPSRTLTIELRKIASPVGYPGPSFEGTVFEGATPLSEKFYMLWVSDYYRRAKLELENVTGVSIPDSAGANDFRSIYDSAGWDLTVVTGDTDLAVPAGVSATDPWTRAELHAFMLANRNPATNLDKEWQTYHVSVPFDGSGEDSGLAGVMFDELGDQREGACNFIQNFTGVHNDDRVKLRSAVHEIGHGFNQLHPRSEGGIDDNSIMSQTRVVRAVITSGGGVYPDDINFTFNEHNRHHLIHSPDVAVRPGGEDFEFGHLEGFAPEAEDNADAAGIELQLKISSNRLKLGEPLILRLELINNGKHEHRVPVNIGTAVHHAAVTVTKSGEKARHFRSFIIACGMEDYKELKPGQSVRSEETIYWDSNGFIFQSPGMHLVSVRVSWEDEGQPFAAKATGDVWVDYPTTDEDNQVASLLLHNEVGKYIALGGNAYHLKEAVTRIEQAIQVAKAHPAVQRIIQINEASKKPRIRKKQNVKGEG